MGQATLFLSAVRVVAAAVSGTVAPDDLTAGSFQCLCLCNRSGGIMGIGVEHRLDGHRRIAADEDIPCPHSAAGASVCRHSPLLSALFRGHGQMSLSISLKVTKTIRAIRASKPAILI